MKKLMSCDKKSTYSKTYNVRYVTVSKEGTLVSNRASKPATVKKFLK